MEYEELVYFEQFAELVESGDDIDLEALRQLISGTDTRVLAELTEGYFDDLLSSVPDDEAELYTLLQAIGTTLSALARDDSTDTPGQNAYAEEFYRFRNWYTADSRVIRTDRKENIQTEVPLMEALTNYRIRNFVDDECDYDFSDARDYPLDEYIVSLSSLNEDEDDDYDEDDE